MYHRKLDDGQHVILEGIDGSGKSTVMAACHMWAEGRGAKVFDAVDFMRREKRLPTVRDLDDATVLLNAEPSFCWIGAAIREEIIAQHEPTEDIKRYSGSETADAFALDRLVLYRRLIIPFLKNRPERVVFQDRGLASSLAYQPLQDPALSSDDLLQRPGNAQAIAFAPTVILLIHTDAAVAMSRLMQRQEKRDEHIFEKQDFQTRLAQRFCSDDVLNPFRRAGTVVVEIDGNAARDVVAHKVKQLLTQHLGKNQKN